MQTFTDNAARTWTVAINVESIRRVRSVLGIDLLEAVDGKLIERLSNDPILLCDVLFVICQPEAEQRGISDEDFGRAMAGDVIDHATASLLEELVGFFPKNRRGLLSKALRNYRNLETKAVALVDKQLDDPAMENTVLTQLEQKLSEPLTYGD